jgi:hypothetical protein
MSKKKMEGNEEQRRQKARDARRQGKSPSELRVTQGASRQRRHLPDDEDHVEKLAHLREGKQPNPGIHVAKPKPRPGSKR